MEIKNKNYYYSNFKRNNKWLGIIDYRLILFLLIYVLVSIKLFSSLKIELETAFSVFCGMSVPIVALILISYKEENSIEALMFIIKYMLSRKIFVSSNVKKFKGEIYK